MKRIFVFVTIIALIAGCSQKRQPAEPPQPRYHTHIITGQGETLANIAKWYTGSSSNWQNILAHNPGLDVRRMRIGTEIQIPENMLTRNTPMPKRAYKPQAVANTNVVKDEAAPETAPENSVAAAEIDSTEPVKELSTEEIDQMMAESESTTFPADNASQQATNDSFGDPSQQANADTMYDNLNETAEIQTGEQRKGFLSKFQEAAMKAQENAMKAEGEQVQAVNKSNQPLPPVDTEQYQKQAEAAQNTAKAQMDAANAQLKAAQDQAAQAIDQANEQAAAQQNDQTGTKTREQLIKELTQDY